MTPGARSRRVALLALAIALAVPTIARPPEARAAEAAKPAKSTKKSTSSAARDTSKVLVRVGKEPITSAMVQARLDQLPEQYRAQYATPSGRQQLLERMVEEKVWLVEATRHGVADRPKVKEQLDQQRRDLIIRTWINEQMATNSAPPDSEVRAYYDAHLAEYKTPATAVVRHIQLKTEADAKKVLAMARDPKKDFADLAAKFSEDTLTRKNGGLLGTVSREGMFPTLGSQPFMADSVFAVGDGKVTGPFKTDRGWHVLKVDRVQPESTRPFEQTRPMIVRQLSGQRTQEYYKKLLEEARHDIGVSADSAAIKNFVSAKKSAREMFKEAQEATGTQTRLDAYQRLLDTWPRSDVAPQAQFMIGFIHSEELKDYDGAEKAFRSLLASYPKSELANSAHWMIDHMRTEEAPAFITQEAESSRAPSPQASGTDPERARKKPGSPGKP